MNVRRSVIILAIVAATAPLAAAPAGACCAASVPDADDVPGKLDLARVTWSKSFSNAPLEITVETHEAWRPRVLRSQTGNRLWVRIDADRNGTVDYSARIRRVDGQLLVFITGSDSMFEPLPAQKPDGRTVQFSVPGDSPPNPPGRARLFAKSRDVTADACSAGCVDRTRYAGTY